MVFLIDSIGCYVLCVQNLFAGPISLSKATPLQGWLYKILVCLVDQARFGILAMSPYFRPGMIFWLFFVLPDVFYFHFRIENTMQLISQLDCSDSVLMSTDDETSILCFACFDFLLQEADEFAGVPIIISTVAATGPARRAGTVEGQRRQCKGSFTMHSPVVPVQLQVYCLGFSSWRWMAVILSIFGWKLLEIRCFNYFHPKWRSEAKLKDSWLILFEPCSKRFQTWTKVHLDLLDPAPQGHGITTLADKVAKMPLLRPFFR